MLEWTLDREGHVGGLLDSGSTTVRKYQLRELEMPVDNKWKCRELEGSDYGNACLWLSFTVCSIYRGYVQK